MAGQDNLKPFKPGVDPRRGSKPKGAIHLSTHIQNMLNDEEFERLIPDQIEGYRKEKGAPIKAIIKTAMIRAEAGDQKWADWLAKYGYGQKLVHSNDPESPITNPAEKSLVDAFIENLKNESGQAKPN